MGRFLVFFAGSLSLLGAGLSTFFGACLVPWLWALVFWSASSFLPSLPSSGPFPNPLISLLNPSLLLGLVWLAYYCNAYICSMFYPLPRKSLRTEVNQLPPRSQELSSERQSELIQYCYQQYREALARHNPLPIKQLKTPPQFFCWSGNALEWKEGFLLLPEALLDPAHLHLLLPLLAHHLAYYNGPDVELQGVWDTYPDHTFWLLTLSGNFLWVPVMIKKAGLWKAWQAKQLLEADTFAYWLGQGEALKQYLQDTYISVQRTERPDLVIPELVERIDHLKEIMKQTVLT
jgi:hypothetical protein